LRDKYIYLIDIVIYFTYSAGIKGGSLNVLYSRGVVMMMRMAIMIQLNSIHLLTCKLNSPEASYKACGKEK
jgi:hypothetical protein